MNATESGVGSSESKAAQLETIVLDNVDESDDERGRRRKRLSLTLVHDFILNEIFITAAPVARPTL